MKVADHSNFVTMLSEEKPGMVFVHHKAEAAQAQKIKLILKSIAEELPLLPLYDFIVDDNEENQTMADFLGLTSTPVLLFFKNGNFNRYKNKMFNKNSILTFIGYSKPYLEEEARLALEKKEAEAKTKKTKKPTKKSDTDSEDIDSNVNNKSSEKVKKITKNTKTLNKSKPIKSKITKTIKATKTTKKVKVT